MTRQIESGSHIRSITRSPVYAIADELEAMTYRKDQLSLHMEEARRRFGKHPSVYLDNPWDWPRPGTVGVWLRGHEVIVRWIDPHSGIHTSAHRRTAE